MHAQTRARTHTYTLAVGVLRSRDGSAQVSRVVLLEHKGIAENSDETRLKLHNKCMNLAKDAV